MLELLFKNDGVWIHAESGKSSKSGLLNLNNIVNEMHPGIIKSAFLNAISESMAPDPVDEVRKLSQRYGDILDE